MVSSNLAYQDIEIIEAPQIKDEPLKWCSVSLSDVISRGKRLEASVFDVEAKQARQTIANNKYGIKSLGTADGLIDNAYYPGRFKRVYCSKENGVAFYLPSQMNDTYPKPDKFISIITKCSIDELRLKPKTLLLTRSGTIGTISYVSKTLTGKVFSDDVIRVTFKDSIDSGYIYTFLKTRAGQKILTTNGYGSVITHLEPEHLNELPIPNAPYELKQKINNLIVYSYRLRDESNELIDKATQLLIDELQLPDVSEFEVDDFKKNAPVETFSVKLSDLNGRVDASYHVPIVNAITAHLKKHADEVTTIGDNRISSDIILPGRFKRVYVEEGYGIPFFGGRSIGELDPSDKRFLSFSQHNEKIKNELTIKEGMILITCSGTVGNIALVPKHWDNWAMTHDIIRLVSLDGIKGYVYIWLQSDYGKELIKSKSYGSVVTHIEKSHLAEIPIPLLKNLEIQRKINNLALQANQKRYEAYKLEQQALAVMDNEVIFA